MSFDPNRPYNDIPILPPSIEVETKAVLKLCIEARAALAELKQAGDLIPNQAILINTIPVLEAQASSQIENIVTTSDRLFQVGQGGSPDDPDTDAATRETSRYRTALYQGFMELSRRPLTTATAISICSAIHGVEMEIRRVPGTTLANSLGQVIYTPPAGEPALRGLLGNWERYLHEETDTDPLVKMAVAHYQFEAIHPFTDGNGRTGRILNILYLIDAGLLDLPVLYLSRYILANRADYYRLLLGVTTDGAWEPWIRYMMSAVIDTARWTTVKIRAVRDQMQQAKDYMRAHARAIYSHELLDILFTYPYCRIDYLVDAHIVGTRQTASAYLKTLCEIGMLSERKAGRNKLFVHDNLQRLLTTEENEGMGYPIGRS